MSNSNNEGMLLLLDEAYAEGVKSMEATVKKAADDAFAEGHDKGYTEGYGDALKTIPFTPSTEEQAEGGTPIHNIENLATKAFFDELEKGGYGKDDYSKVWPYLFMAQTDRDEPSWTECCNPYVLYGKGTKVIVSCSDEPSQTVLPYKEMFRIFGLTPGKTYAWKMYNGTKVLSKGEFKTTGRVRWAGTNATVELRNFRDLGGFGIKFGRLYRSENPDTVKAGSAEHLYLRDFLKISVQVNLRDSGARKDLFEKTYNYNIPAYSDVFTSSGLAKFRNAFNAIVNELKAGKNILFNCKQGCDRTGTMAWLIQSLCGMPLGYSEGHWELSGFDRCGNSKIWNWEEAAGGELRAFILKLIQKYGNDPYTMAYRLATEVIGITDAKIKELRAVLVA